MPQRDGTGPDGKGPLTGRRMGNCKSPRYASTRLRRNIRKPLIRRRNYISRRRGALQSMYRCY